MSQDTPLLESDRDHCTYIGTVMLRNTDWWASKLRISKREDLRDYMSDHEWTWLNKQIPDWLFWKDEFRLQAHLYVDRRLSENMLMLASLIFAQTEPSHYPLGKEYNWIRRDAT